MAVHSPAEILIQSRDEIWDLEDSTADSVLWSSPLGRFVIAFRTPLHDAQAMQWLALFAARRAIACWHLYCDESKPLDGIRAAERYLAGQASINPIRDFVEPAVPSFRGRPIVDCRQCDTSCAAAAVAHMARLIVDGNPRDLAICLSSADMAFAQSPLVRQDEFRRWLIEVATPVAVERRDLADEEASRFRTYSVAELDIERERPDDGNQQKAQTQRSWWRFWEQPGRRPTGI